MLTTLARLFIDLLKIGANSVDAKRLKDYKAPKSASNATFNDFASVLFEVLKSRGYTRYLHFTWCLFSIMQGPLNIWTEHSNYQIHSRGDSKTIIALLIHSILLIFFMKLFFYAYKS